MRCDPNKLFVATAVTFAVAWVICVAFVVLMPADMMTMTGHMVHANLEEMSWSMTPTGFFVGLFAWSLLAGALVWLIAGIYNKLPL